MSSNPAFYDWFEVLTEFFNEKRTDFSIKELNDRLDDKPLATLLWYTSVLSNLAGREDMSQERTDAIIPDWLNLSFLEAIEVLKRKLVIPKYSYKDMVEGYHSWAFSVAKITKLQLLDDIKKSLLTAMDSGTPFEEWKEKFFDRYKREYGNTPTDRRAYIIFDTNLRSAHGTGRGQQMKEIVDRNPDNDYVGVWRWRDSRYPRPHHQALNNKAIPYSHKFWQKCSIPAGYGCRCTVSLLKRSLAEQLGIEVLDNPPNPETIAEKGFRYPNWGTPKPSNYVEQKKADLSPEAQQLI